MTEVVRLVVHPKWKWASQSHVNLKMYINLTRLKEIPHRSKREKRLKSSETRCDSKKQFWASVVEFKRLSNIFN